MPAPDPPPEKPPGAFRLLHTADWHLGKLLNDQSRDEEHRRFLEWLLAAAREHAVDAILLAGDVFDSASPPQSALARYYDFVSALHRQGGCALVVIGGNHDSAPQLEAPRQVLHALDTHVAGALAEDPAARILCLPRNGGPRVLVALIPFLRDRDLRAGRAGESAEETRAQLAAGIRRRYEETAEAAAALALDCPLIATGHLTVAGSRTSDSERDIHIGGLGAVDEGVFPPAFSYVALGHLHRPQAVGGERTRYAGSPLALSFSESDDIKETRLLDVTPEGLLQHSLAVPVFRRLARLRTTAAELEAAIAAFSPGPSELPAWVEILVEDATLAADLNERAQEAARGRGFEVLKVLRGRPDAAISPDPGDDAGDDAIETLLDHPAKVFAHLLEQHEEIGPERAETLRVAFACLAELVDQADVEPQPPGQR